MKQARVSPPVWADHEAHFTLPFEPLDETPYQIEAVILDAAGQVVEMVATTVRRQPTPWLGNTLGCAPVVVPPFTPIETDGLSLACYGRKHVLGPAGLLEQATVRGRPLLAGPIRLVAMTKLSYQRDWYTGEPLFQYASRNTALMP